MSIPIPFSKGVTSLLKCKWTLQLKTPLVIQASTNGSIHNKKNEHAKGRESQYYFRWEEPTNVQGKKDEWSAIRDFNYEFAAGEDNKLVARYSIPGSSIRGALRQWTIKALVKDDEMSLFTLPKLDKDDTIGRAIRMLNARVAVENPDNYWHDVLSLFGIAYDLNPGVDEPLIWSGRLEMGSVKLHSPDNVSSEGLQYEENEVNACAPKNISIHTKTRSPLDRVTMAAKKGGLHSVIEMSEGQTFTLEFRIVNPRQNDLKIVKLWKRDIDAGFIRFGGLSSQGRGKTEIVSDAYQLYAACNTPLDEAIRGLGKPEIAHDFAGIWTGAELDFETLLDENIMAALNVVHLPS